MGGNAFRTILATSVFPRMPPAVYRKTKSRLMPKLQDLYTHVVVPFEAPEKIDHGDIDFLVAIPKILPTSEDTTRSSVNVPHQVTLRALGATHMLPMDGNRTSHFAVPIQREEWDILGHGKEENEARRLSERGELFYQVDVHVCTDVAEWERILFFHSYGDFQIILADVVRSVGLKLGENGIYLPIPGKQAMKLSQSVDDIMRFLGLSMNTWRTGFSTKQEVFEWVGTSPLFHASALNLGERTGARKVKPDRVMYRQFITWVKDGLASSAESIVLANNSDQEDHHERQRKLQEDALDFFGKRDEFHALQDEHCQKLMKDKARKVFNGTIVGEWTNLTGKWLTVKKVMDTVRERIGGDRAILRMIQDNREDELKSIVISVAKESQSTPSTEDETVQSISNSLEHTSLTSSSPHVDPLRT